MITKNPEKKRTFAPRSINHNPITTVMKQKRLALFHRAALMLLFAVLGSAGTWAAPDGDELPAPTDLEVYDVNEHGAWLRWKSDAKHWLISLSTNPGTDIYDGWYRISEDTSYELTGLDSEKEYYVSVCAIEVKAGAMGMMYIVKQSEPARCSFVTHSEGAGEQEDPAAITTIQQHSADTFWFTLDGRRLTDKPTRKGVYIHLGKKQVVK